MTPCARAVLITGAASGIGAALARRVAAPGVGMALHSGGSTPDSARRFQGVLAACTEAGAQCVVTTGDLAETGQGAPPSRPRWRHSGGSIRSSMPRGM